MTLDPQRFRSLESAFEFNQHVMVIFDLEGRVSMVNRAARESCLALFGWRLTSGDALVDILGSGQAEKVRPFFLEAQAGRQVVVEQDFPLPSGSSRWFEVAFQPLFDDKGRLFGVLLTGTDITDRKRVELDLWASREELAALVRSFPAPIIVLEGEGLVAVWNPAAERTFGWRAEEALGRPSLIIPEGEREENARVVAAVGQGRVVINHESVRRRKDGSLVEVSLSAAPIHDGSGRITGQVEVLVDSSERRAAERALAESEARYREIFDHGVLGIFRSTVEGRFLVANPAMARFLNYESPEQLIAACPDISRDLYFDPEQRRVIHDTLRENPSLHTFEVPLKKRGGGVAQVRMNLRLQRAPDGGEQYFEGFIEDITREVEAEQQRQYLESRMQQLHKLESLGVLAGGVAHEFNNLLMVILGNASLARLDLDREHPSQASLSKVENAARRAADLTGRMLAYSGGGRFVTQATDMSRFIESQQDLIQALVHGRAEIKLVLAEQLPEVDLDLDQMRQLLTNLVNNAAEAVTGALGVVTIRTGVVDADRKYLSCAHLDEGLEPGRYVFLEVEDNGAGIGRENRERLFEPFFSTKFTGRGLGLSAVLGIARSHRGTVCLRTEPGLGSAFRVLIPPRVVPEEVPAPAPPVSRPRRGKPRILLAEDHELVREVTRRILEREGFKVTVAVDGIETVQLFSAAPHSFDLLVVDLTMPRMGGAEAVARIRQIQPDVRVILSSGFNEVSATLRFANLELSGFIQKPYQPQDLVAKIRAIL